MSFRNRTVICGSNGLINLSVPIEHGRSQKLSFKHVKISYHEDWRKHHWRSIFSCYGKSPFFEYYRHDLEKFLSKRHEYLFDLNLEVLEWIKKMLHFPAEIIVVGEEDFETYSPVAENFSDRWLPKNFQQDGDFVKYPQVFEDRIGFQPNLSVLDLLFNTGPGAADFLQ